MAATWFPPFFCVSVIASIYFVFLFNNLLPQFKQLHFSNDSGDMPVHSDPHVHQASVQEAVLVTSIFHVFFLLLVTSFVRAVLTPPGSIPRTEGWRKQTTDKDLVGPFPISQADNRRVRNIITTIVDPIPMSTRIALKEGQTCSTYSDGESLAAKGVDFVKACGNRGEGPSMVQYNQQGDMVDLSAYMRSGTGAPGGKFNVGYTKKVSGETGRSYNCFRCQGNWLITFDLDMIRVLYFRDRIRAFTYTGRFRVGDSADASNPGQGVVFVDGVVAGETEKVPKTDNWRDPSDGWRDLSVIIDASAKYLTVASLNGNTKSHYDDQVWRNPTLSQRHELTGSDICFLQGLPVVERKQKNGKHRYCKLCALYKPDRCHHCRVCGTCVLRMDHHCPWIANCVGYHNYKFFLLLLFYSICCTSFILCAMLPRLLNAFQPVLDPFYFVTMDLPVCVVWVLCFSIFSALSIFLTFHLSLVLNAVTTIELKEKKNSEDESVQHRFRVANHKWNKKSKYGNLKHVFGPLWMWLLPISPISLNDGTYSKTKYRPTPP